MITPPINIVTSQTAQFSPLMSYSSPTGLELLSDEELLKKLNTANIIDKEKIQEEINKREQTKKVNQALNVTNLAVTSLARPQKKNIDHYIPIPQQVIVVNQLEQRPSNSMCVNRCIMLSAGIIGAAGGVGLAAYLNKGSFKFLTPYAIIGGAVIGVVAGAAIVCFRSRDPESTHYTRLN